MKPRLDISGQPLPLPPRARAERYPYQSFKRIDSLPGDDVCACLPDPPEVARGREGFLILQKILDLAPNGQRHKYQWLPANPDGLGPRKHRHPAHGT